VLSRPRQEQKRTSSEDEGDPSAETKGDKRLFRTLFGRAEAEQRSGDIIQPGGVMFEKVEVRHLPLVDEPSGVEMFELVGVEASRGQEKETKRKHRQGERQDQVIWRPPCDARAPLPCGQGADSAA